MDTPYKGSVIWSAFPSMSWWRHHYMRSAMSLRLWRTSFFWWHTRIHTYLHISMLWFCVVILCYLCIYSVCFIPDTKTWSNTQLNSPCCLLLVTEAWAPYVFYCLIFYNLYISCAISMYCASFSTLGFVYDDATLDSFSENTRMTCYIDAFSKETRLFS